MTRLFAAFALAFWVAMGGIAPACAQEPAPRSDADMARARELFENGKILYDEGRYEDAITAWEESYRLSGRAELYFNISSAWEKLGDYSSAIDALNRYRVYAPADERPVLDRRIRALEQRLAEQPPVVAPAPAPVPVVEPERRVRVLPIVLIGTGVASLGAGAVTGAIASGAMSDLRESCFERDDGLLCPIAAEPAVKRHGTTSTLSAVTLGAGGALALTGGLVLALGGRSGDVNILVDGHSVALKPVFAINGGGATAGLTWSVARR